MHVTLPARKMKYNRQKLRKIGVMIMWKYVLKRIGLALMTSCIILSLTFILIKCLPFERPVGLIQQQFSYYEDQVHQGFVLRFNFPQSGYGDLLFKYQLPSTNTTYHYYLKPIMAQYTQWLGNILTKWDWGTSSHIQINVSASAIIANQLPYTVKVNIFATLISVPLGILLGIVAALNKNKPIDHFLSTAVMIMTSIPSFVLIAFLMLLLCYNNHILPTQWPADSAPMQERVLGYILPVCCLSFGSIAGYCRFVRAELCEVMSSEYLLLARTKGLTKQQAILRHALRNAMVPIVPSILAEVIGLLGGSMILESLYGIPGIGRLYTLALTAKDYNVLFVDMAVFTTISLLAGVILDISYGFIDPRIRMGAKK